MYKIRLPPTDCFFSSDTKRKRDSFNSFGTSRGIGARQIIALIYSIDIRTDSDCKLHLENTNFLVRPRTARNARRSMAANGVGLWERSRTRTRHVRVRVWDFVGLIFPHRTFPGQLETVDFPRFPSPVGRLRRAHERHNGREDHLNPFISPLTRASQHRNDCFRFIITDA